VVPTALSLLDEHDADLDEYPEALAVLHGWQLVTAPDGRRFYRVPVATALVALPAVAVARLADDGLEADVRAGRPTAVEPLVAALLVAATAAVVHLTARSAGASAAVALATAALFAFATPAWSTGSRALWMHDPSMLALALALWCLVRASPATVAGAGALLALAVFVRPTNAVAVVVFGAWLLWTRRSSFPWFAAGGALVTAALAALNLVLYGSVLPDYVRDSRLGLSGTTAVALAGNLVSPARGLLVYSPVLALAALGWWRRRADPLADAVAAVVAGHWLVISLFPHWWGGWSYGPRFWTDVLPLLAFLLPPALAGLRARPAALAAVSALAAWSAFTHARGATDIAGFAWNTTPTNVDTAPGRLWDWSDPPFLR
jgi:hypothetical protein